MKRFKMKLWIILVLGVSVFSTVSYNVSSVVYANEVQNVQQEIIIGEINKDELVQGILKDIQQEMLPELRLEQPKYKERGAGGLIATLIAKYGIVYIKKTLPRLIYKHVGKYLGRKVSEQAFVRVFANIVDWGTGAAIEQGLARALIRLGVDSNTANTVASVVVTVGWWFI